MKALIVKSTSTAYSLEDGTTAVLKGNFRTKGIRSTNPVAVGDYVEVEVQADGTQWITDIYDRKNYIIRKSTNLSKESHILAANVDQVMLLVTINHPQTSTTFIDRFLATCEAYRVPVILVFNKVDLLTDEEQVYLQQLRDLYESLNYPTFAISAKEFINSSLSPTGDHSAQRFNSSFFCNSCRIAFVCPPPPNVTSTYTPPGRTFSPSTVSFNIAGI